MAFPACTERTGVYYYNAKAPLILFATPFFLPAFSLRPLFGMKMAIHYSTLAFPYGFLKVGQ